MEIRAINKEDNLLDIANIYVESWKHSYKNIIDSDYLANLSPGKWVPYLQEADHSIFVAIEDNRYVGIITFSDLIPIDSKNGDIYSIYILPEYQNKGIGSKLIKQAVDKLIESDFKDVSVYVMKENYQGRSFYEKENFILTGKAVNNTISNDELTLVQYVLQIC